MTARSIYRRVVRLAVAGSVAAAMLVIPAAAHADEDVAAPELVEFSFAPTSVDTSSGSADVTFTVRVTDDLSGLQSGSIQIYSPSGSQQTIESFSAGDLFSGDALDGVYTLTLTIPRYSETGTWEVREVFLIDMVGNHVRFDTSELAAATFPTGIAVAGDEDVAAPELVEFSFAPTSVDTSSGSADVTFTVRVTDDLSGLQSGSIQIYSPSGSQQTIESFSAGDLFSGDALDGVYTLTLTIPRYSETGTWEVREVFLIDMVGNHVRFDTSELAAATFPTGIAVAGDEDVAAPELVEFSFAPTSVDTSSGSADVTFTVRVTDDLSGLQSGSIQIYSPSGSQQTIESFSAGDLFSGDALDGVYTLTLTIPRYSETGTWEVREVFLIDMVGNHVRFDTSELAAATFPTGIANSNDESPVAHDEAVSTPVETPVDITLTGSDPTSDPLTFAVVDDPTHGVLSGTAPDVTYTPDGGYEGADSFTFEAFDGTWLSNEATVNITVTSSTSVGTEAELKAALVALSSDLDGPHTVILTDDIVLVGGHAVYSGDQDLTIDGDGHSVSGNGASRVFYFPILDGVTVTLTNMIVEDGWGSGEGSGGAGIKVNASGTNGGDLVVVNSVVRNNYTTEDGGGIAVSYGGDLTLIDSMVLDNRGEDGGGVTGSHVEVIRSTVANNQADSWEAGGGIFGGSVTLINSTVTGNSAGDGSGVYSRGPLEMVYSTVAGNTGGTQVETETLDGGAVADLTAFGSVVANPSSSNCAIDGATTSTYSYDDGATCGFVDATDTSNGADPALGVLADNGGPTNTMLPAADSPLLDAIPSAACDTTHTTDQRGISRPKGTHCDIGSVELVAPTSVGTEAELKAALVALSSDLDGPHTVILTDDIVLVGGHAVYSGDQDLTIDGDGHSVSGNGASRVFYFPILDGVTVTLTNMIVEDGWGSGEGSGGAGIKVNASGTNGGDLVVVNSVVRNNYTTEDGGGIAVSYGGDLTLIDSMVLDNRGEDGGGVTGSHVEVIRSTVANNQADSWEAGGGIFGGSVTLINSTVTGNSAGDGSGVYSRGPLEMVYSTVAGNTGGTQVETETLDGGAVADLTAFGSVVANPSSSNCAIDGATTSTYSYDDGATCGFVDATDTSNGADPALGVLADNGGPTNTMLPAADSPLLDAIPSAACDTTHTTDQRGISRPKGTHCDIGSVELVPTPVEDPVLVVDVPANGEVVAASSLVFDGSASDDVGVTRVALAVYDRELSQYWDGAGWLSGYRTVDAVLDDAGALVDGLVVFVQSGGGVVAAVLVPGAGL